MGRQYWGHLLSEWRVQRGRWADRLLQETLYQQRCTVMQFSIACALHTAHNQVLTSSVLALVTRPGQCTRRTVSLARFLSFDSFDHDNLPHSLHDGSASSMKRSPGIT